ncbi:MAG: hypothetical protein AB8B80_05480 [Marinicellaceae bacterium]
MKIEAGLKTYWITFPKDNNLPFGLGVTALSQEDAFELAEEQGIYWHKNANELHIQENVRISDLDQSNIVPNIGPMQFRGVWYPCQNIGYGAPKNTEYKPLK